MRSYRCGVEQSVSAGALSLLRGSYRGLSRSQLRARAVRFAEDLSQILYKIQVQIGGRYLLLHDFQGAFLVRRRLSAFGTNGSCPTRGDSSYVRTTSREPSRAREGWNAFAPLEYSEHSGEPRNSAVLQERTIRGNSRQGPNITVTQGNQLRNKLSFYRILNRAPPPAGREILRAKPLILTKGEKGRKEKKKLVRSGDCSRDPRPLDAVLSTRD